MIQVKTVLSQIIDALTLNLTINSVTDNGDGTYTISVENTQYLNTDAKVTIDSVEYTVQSFILNDSLILSGDSAPTTGVKTIANPTFVHGKYKMVNSQLSRMTETSYLPLVWLFELLPRTQPEEEDSSIDSEGQVRLFFVNSAKYGDWENEDHYDEVFDPLNNLIDAFILKLRNSSLIGELGVIERTNHARFTTGGQTISGASEANILPANVSAVEVLIDLPIKKNLTSCDGLPDSSCAPGLVKDQQGNELGLVPSGGFLQVNTSGIDATVENSDNSYNDTVASGGTLILPDIQVTDSDGSTFTQPSVVNVVCSLAADGTVNVNSVFFDNVASGGTLNIEVRQSSGSTLIGSKQGQYFRIPDSVITLNNTDASTIATTNVLATDSATITAPDATAVIKNTLNAVLRSELIPSNVSEDIIIGDATININKSDGTLIASATVTAEGSGVYSVADSTVNVVNTLGSVLSTSSVKATDTESVLAPDANVENSDGSYLDTVASGDTLVLPDISITINGEAQPNEPAAKNLALSYTPQPDYEFHFTADDVVESAGLVSQLNDQSYNGNNATQTNGSLQPSYTGSDANYNNHPSLTINQDFFVLDKWADILYETGFYFHYVGNINLGGSNILQLLGIYENQFSRISVISSNRMYVTTSKTSRVNGNAIATLTGFNSPCIFTVKSDGSTLSFYINGTLNGSSSIAYENDGVTHILNANARSVNLSEGVMADFRLYNDHDLTKLNSDGSALATKYGFTWNTIS